MNIIAATLLIVFWAMTVIVLRTTPITLSKSLSWHIAQTRRGILYGKIGLTVGGALLAVSLFGYVIPAYDLGFLSIILSIITVISGTLTAYLPYEVSQRQNRWHDGLIICYVILNPILLMMVYPGLSTGWLKTTYAVGIVVQIALILVFAVTKPGRRTMFLPGQLLFMSIFAALLAIS